MTRRYCLTLDLKNDPDLIAEYRRYHEQVWPEITKGIRDSGIEDLEIYLLGTRTFMIMEVNETFSFAAKAEADRNNPKVQECGSSSKPCPRRSREKSGFRWNGCSNWDHNTLNHNTAADWWLSEPPLQELPQAGCVAVFQTLKRFICRVCCELP